MARYVFCWFWAYTDEGHEHAKENGEKIFRAGVHYRCTLIINEHNNNFSCTYVSSSPRGIIFREDC